MKPSFVSATGRAGKIRRETLLEGLKRVNTIALADATAFPLWNRMPDTNGPNEATTSLMLPFASVPLHPITCPILKLQLLVLPSTNYLTLPCKLRRLARPLNLHSMHP